MKITDIPIEARYYGSPDRTQGREVREGHFDGATHFWCPQRSEWMYPIYVPCNEAKGCGQFWSRPIDVGEGWELVGLDESIQEGDEYFDGFSKWSASANPGLLVRESLIPCKVVPYRRRKKPEHQPAQSGEWVSVKERQPEKGASVWLAWQTGDVSLAVIYCDVDGHATHWMPANIPKPPEPAKTDAEAAWTKFEATVTNETGMHDTFIAGYAAGKEAR